MDSSANYLAQTKDVKDGVKTAVESGDEEIVVFANGSGNGLKSTGNHPSVDVKKAVDGVDAKSGKADGTAPGPAGAADKDASGLADAFSSLTVNTKTDAKFDYGPLNDYRAAKYPSISVSPHGDVNGSAGGDWAPKAGGRKPGDEQAYGGSPLYGRPLNAAASDFQHRGAPAYPGYGAPGAPYGSYPQGVPAVHGGYGYDVFGLSPTLTEPAVANGVPGGPANSNAGNGAGVRYAPRSSTGPDGSGMGLTLNGLNNAGGAPYSPIPLSPSPLSLNPYAAHQMQLNHMNGHPMGAYGPPPPAQGKNDASSMGGVQGSNAANSGPNGTGATAGSAARGYAPGQAFNMPPMPYGVSPGGQYYDESAAMYANAYGAPHLQPGMHPGVHPQHQMGYSMPPPHPGTPQMGAYGGYMGGPVMPVPGVGPGVVTMPGATTPGTQNGTAVGANGGQADSQQAASNGSANGAPVKTVVNGLTLINGVPQPNPDGTGPSLNNRKLGLYKTELCRSWEEKGSCRYGAKCQFAHGEEEIRKVARHPKYKTEICRTFWLSGSCPYGKRCCFIHTDAPANGAGEAGKAGGPGTGPSTAAANGASTPNPPMNPAAESNQASNHARTASAASEANEQPQSSILARIAKRAGEDGAPPQGPPRIATGGVRPDYSHNRHLSSMSDGRPVEAEAAPTFTARPGHSHSASAHTLMTPTFASPNGGLGYGSGSGTPSGVDGNGNLTPGSFWGHKRSASGGSATNGGWNTPGADTPTSNQPEQPMRSIYSALTPTA